MSELFTSAPILLGAIVGGYVLGSLPLANWISRHRGVDIFSAGTGLGGASNVLRSTGKGSAAVVLLGDISKGALAIVVGKLLGLEDHWIVVPGAAAIVGHWNSVFAGFRGGDGLATLGGVMIALFPLHGFIGVVVAGTVALGSRKMPYTSLLCIVFGYLAIVILNLTYAGDAALTLGAGGIAAMVLAHAIRGHLRRRRSEDWVDGTPEREGLAP